MVCGSYGLGSTGLEGEFQSGRREGEVDGITVVELELPYSNENSFARRILTFVRFAFSSAGIALTRDYDLVFATSTPLTAAIPGIAGRVVRRKPFVFEVRDLWPELPKAMGVITNPLILVLMSWLEWLAYRSATSCIGLSPGIVDGIRRRAGPNKRVTLIPNGCDLKLFSSESKSERGFDGVGDDEFVAAFTGAHGLANGLDAVLDAAGELQSRDRNDIKLILIGDGKCKPALQERAAAQELANLIFMEPVAKTELTRLLLHADAGLMVLADVPAFYYGTSPNKFFDYIAIGLPVINNYPGWLAEMINKESIGVAVNPGEAAAFADALEYLADNKQERIRMGENARGLAKSEFDRAELADRFVNELVVAASQ